VLGKTFEPKSHVDKINEHLRILGKEKPQYLQRFPYIVRAVKLKEFDGLDMQSALEKLYYI
jgi:hypothetical protein